MKPNTIPDAVMARLLKTSYRNYHALGVDYVCLRRTPALTLKVYFFDTAPSLEDPVVNPHSHRYDFSSTVIRGSVNDVIWRPNAAGQLFDRWQYRTPLNGGTGFKYDRRTALHLDACTTYGPGASWQSKYNTIHTLARVQPGTVMALEQYADIVPSWQPTHTYTKVGSRMHLSLDGLYDSFTADQIMARLRQLETISPGALSWLGA